MAMVADGSQLRVVLALGRTRAEAVELVRENRLGLHPKTVVRMAREGRLPAVKVGNGWRFQPDRLHIAPRRRAAVEREFGRLKHDWALLPLRVRGLERVRLHADLTILAKLGCTLTRARAVTARRQPPRAAMLRS